MLIGCNMTAEVCKCAASAPDTACYHLYSTQVQPDSATSIYHKHAKFQWHAFCHCMMTEVLIPGTLLCDVLFCFVMSSVPTLGLQKPCTTSFQMSSGSAPLRCCFSSSVIASSGIRGWRVCTTPSHTRTSHMTPWLLELQNRRPFIPITEAFDRAWREIAQSACSKHPVHCKVYGTTNLTNVQAV